MAIQDKGIGGPIIIHNVENPPPLPVTDSDYLGLQARCLILLTLGALVHRLFLIEVELLTLRLSTSGESPPAHRVCLAPLLVRNCISSTYLELEIGLSVQFLS